jgi:ribosomal protein S27E
MGDKAFGHRQTTIRCEECLKTTSIYASIYFCPRCTGRLTLLETPKTKWGQETTCKTCGNTFVAPNDDILREVDPEHREGAWFSFPCPACDKELSCATRHAGAWVVCVHCAHVLQVPLGGTSQGAPVNEVAPVREVLQPVGTWGCPQCGLRIPKGCAHCPYCRSNLTGVKL